MKQSSFVQLAASLLTLMSVECFPATKSGNPASSGIDATGSHNALTKTMGDLLENKCPGKTMSWNNTSNSWDKLPLAENVFLYQNVWQSAKVARGGMSVVTCSSFQNGVVSWKNVFNMPCAAENNNQVKTYPNVAWSGVPIQLKNIKEFKSLWNWKLTNSSKDLVMDVSYDIFLTKDPNCRQQQCASREIMIWMAAIGGAKPAGSRSPVNGTSDGIFTVGRKYDFQVWQGTVGVPVVSLIPSQDNTKYTSFQGDLKEVLKNLKQFGVDQDEYVLSVGAGIEVFKGQATFHTKQYTIALY